jgi:glycine betaine/proline transport system permease protein
MVMIEKLRQRKSWQFVLLFIVFVLLCVIISPSESNWFWRLPPLIKGLPLVINDSVTYVMNDWWLVDVWDPDIEEYEQKPMMNQFTRSISGLILFMIEFVREILLGGVNTIVTFSSWD